MASNEYDAIVIGSGISGGWGGKEVTGKGPKKVMFESGPKIEHIKNYKKKHKKELGFSHPDLPTQAMKKGYSLL